MLMLYTQSSAKCLHSCTEGLSMLRKVVRDAMDGNLCLQDSCGQSFKRFEKKKNNMQNTQLRKLSKFNKKGRRFIYLFQTAWIVPLTVLPLPIQTCYYKIRFKEWNLTVCGSKRSCPSPRIDSTVMFAHSKLCKMGAYVASAMLKHFSVTLSGCLLTMTGLSSHPWPVCRLRALWSIWKIRGCTAWFTRSWRWHWTSVV